MKWNSRELSILGMPAVDFFKSVAGAFVFVAAVMFPCAPRMGTADRLGVETARTTAQREVGRTRRGAKEARQRALVLPQAIQAGHDELQRFRSWHLDLVIMPENVANIGNEIDGLKGELGDLSSTPVSPVSGVPVGILVFCEGNPEPLLELLSLVGISSSAGNRTSVAKVVEDWKPHESRGRGSNDSRPEALLRDLVAEEAMQWWPQANRRRIVGIVDNPAYQSEEVWAALDEAASYRPKENCGFGSVVFQSTEASEPQTAACLVRVADAGQEEAVKAGGLVSANLLFSLL